jgi:hypothetical protein
MPGRNTRTNPATSRSPSKPPAIMSSPAKRPTLQVCKSLRGKKATLPMLLLLATSESDAAVVVGVDPHQRYLCGGVSGGCNRSL